jgi:hypothetical protein
MKTNTRSTGSQERECELFNEYVKRERGNRGKKKREEHILNGNF